MESELLSAFIHSRLSDLDLLNRSHLSSGLRSSHLEIELLDRGEPADARLLHGLVLRVGRHCAVAIAERCCGLVRHRDRRLDDQVREVGARDALDQPDDMAVVTF